jgi:hypothetical protein
MPAAEVYLSVAASARVTFRRPTRATAVPRTLPMTGSPSELPGLKSVALAYDAIASVRPSHGP